MSQLVSTIIFVAVTGVAYRLWPFPYALTLVSLVQWATSVLVGPMSGFVADRFPRVWVMVGADTLRALVWSTAAIFVVSHLARFPSFMGILCLATAAGTLFQPAYALLMAEVYVADMRTAANALTEMAHRMANVFGSLISGAVTSLGRASWAFGIDAVTFLCVRRESLALRSVESASSAQ